MVHSKRAVDAYSKGGAYLKEGAILMMMMMMMMMMKVFISSQDKKYISYVTIFE